MAKCGNHGIIIPRDKELLTRLYWQEQHSLNSLGKMFGVSHSSMKNVFIELGIKRRLRHTKGQSRFKKCVTCGDPVHKVKHTHNGSFYGRFCKRHWNEHRARLARASRNSLTTNAAEKRRAAFLKWYINGAQNPKGEKSWLIKSRAMLRSAKRQLNLLASLSARSARQRTLQRSCQP